MGIDESDDIRTARARKARAQQLRARSTGAETDTSYEIDLTTPDRDDTHVSPTRPVLDMSGPRLRLFAKSGEFPRATRETQSAD